MCDGAPKKDLKILTNLQDAFSAGTDRFVYACGTDQQVNEKGYGVVNPR
jgi:hypothetical protein